MSDSALVPETSIAGPRNRILMLLLSILSCLLAATLAVAQQPATATLSGRIIDPQLGNFNQIVSYFVFVVVVFIALTVAALFVLRRREPNRTVYLTPGYPVTPIVFLVLIFVLLVLLGSNNPIQAMLGVGVVALGLPRLLAAVSASG